MDAHRLQVKWFATDPGAVDAAELVPAFHRFIQDRRLSELAIDVADYTHVHQGPGVLLVCHDANYGFDLAGGRPGLLYSRKRDWPCPPDERLPAALAASLAAVRLLEQDPELGGRLRFSRDAVWLRINDRLFANDDAALAAWRPALAAALAPLFPDGFSLRRDPDPRSPLTVEVTKERTHLETVARSPGC